MAELPKFKHPLVSALYELLQEYMKGKSGNFMWDALLFGVRGELPSLLKTLDEKPEAVKMIREKLERVLMAGQDIEVKVEEDRIIGELEEEIEAKDKEKAEGEE